jgi:hypothetical protein
MAGLPIRPESYSTLAHPSINAAVFSAEQSAKTTDVVRKNKKDE